MFYLKKLEETQPPIVAGIARVLHEIANILDKRIKALNIHSQIYNPVSITL